LRGAVSFLITAAGLKELSTAGAVYLLMIVESPRLEKSRIHIISPRRVTVSKVAQVRQELVSLSSEAEDVETFVENLTWLFFPPKLLPL
jgi:hypothetical protein